MAYHRPLEPGLILGGAPLQHQIELEHDLPHTKDVAGVAHAADVHHDLVAIISDCEQQILKEREREAGGLTIVALGSPVSGKVM